MVSSLVRVLGMSYLTLAEDAVQDALVRALETWKFGHMPENPAAWLMRAARNRAIDLLRRQAHSIAASPGDPRAGVERAEAEVDVGEHVIADDELRLMFSCCDPGLARPAQVAVILKYLCGFSVREIAQAFLSSEAAVEKRLFRSRRALEERGDAVRGARHRAGAGAPARGSERHLSLFNEGYHGAHPQHAVREDLCYEAMRLGALLSELPGCGSSGDARAAGALLLPRGQALGPGGRRRQPPPACRAGPASLGPGVDRGGAAPARPSRPKARRSPPGTSRPRSPRDMRWPAASPRLTGGQSASSTTCSSDPARRPSWRSTAPSPWAWPRDPRLGCGRSRKSRTVTGSCATRSSPPRWPSSRHRAGRPERAAELLRAALAAGPQSGGGGGAERASSGPASPLGQPQSSQERRHCDADHRIRGTSSRWARRLRTSCKNPLSATKALVQLGLRSHAEGPSHQRLALLEREVTRMQEILQSYLSSCRPPEVMATARVHLGRLVSETLLVLSARADAAGVRLLSRGDALVEGDPRRLEEALVNLVANGIEATPPGGEVVVEVRPDSDRIENPGTRHGLRNISRDPEPPWHAVLHHARGGHRSRRGARTVDHRAARWITFLRERARKGDDRKGKAPQPHARSLSVRRGGLHAAREQRGPDRIRRMGAIEAPSRLSEVLVLSAHV